MEVVKPIEKKYKKIFSLNQIGIVFLLLFGLMGLFLPAGARSLALQMMVFCIFAMGFDICYGYTNQCSLGHAVFFGGGAYGFALAVQYLQVSILPAMFFSLLTGLVLSIFIGLISVRLSAAYFVIVTAIFFSVFYLLSMDMIWLTGGDDGLIVQLPKIHLGTFELSAYNPITNYYFVYFFLIISYLILYRVVKSPLGSVFIAIRENQKRVQFLGYNIFIYKFVAFVISGIFVALSGGLYALTLRYSSADFFSFEWSIMPVIWCLIGGLGSIIGPCIGVVIMFLFKYYVSGLWTYYLIIFGVIILIVARISSKGLVGFYLDWGRGEGHDV